MTGRQVAKTNPKPPAAYNYGGAAGAGHEDFNQEDFLIPFLRIIHTNSPQLMKGDEKYIEGAEAGMLFNTGTNVVYGDAGVRFVLAYKTHLYSEWIPRDDGGGFVGHRELDDPMVEELRQAQGRMGKLDTGNGTELVETFYCYGLLVDEDNLDDFEEIVIGFSSTAITPYKTWAKLLDRAVTRGVLVGKATVKPPVYAIVNRITTVFAENKHGKFYKPQIAFDGQGPKDYLIPTASPLFDAAAVLREQVSQGVKSADMRDADQGADDADAPPTDF